MITIHNGQTRAYLGILNPTECMITEEAGGDYSLSMTHPIDDKDIWTLLKNDRLIQAPVPVHIVPAIRMEAVSYWTTTRSTPLWRVLPYIVRVQPTGGQGTGGGVDLYWNSWTHYSIRATVRYGSPQNSYYSIYYCVKDNVNQNPVNNPDYWSYKGRGTNDEPDSQTQQESVINKPGIKEADLAAGTALVKIQDYNGTYMRVTCTLQSGKKTEGYVAIADCELRGDSQEIGSGEVWTMTAESHIYLEPKTYATHNEEMHIGDTYTTIRHHDEIWNYGTSDVSGHTGYFLRAASELTTPAPDPPETYYATEERVITSQLFRIYSVNVSMDNEVHIEARHLSYDMESKGIGVCSMSEASPPMAVDIVRTAILGDDDRKMITNATQEVDGTVTGEWSWTNGINALLEPDKGIGFQLKAQIIRDNDDIFLLRNTVINTVYHIMYGVNLLGVDWTEDYDGVITRIIPKGKTQQGDDLFLPDTPYIDSPFIGQYVFPHVEVLDVDCQVGKDHEKSDGTKETWTEQLCYEEMRKQAGERFTKDECDIPETTVTVEFLKLGDTEEYKQYRGAENLGLYDWVRVYHPEIGMDFTLQVIGYEWDAIKQRYTSISLGRAYAKAGHGRQISAWEISNQAVHLETLSTELRRTLGV